MNSEAEIGLSLFFIFGDFENRCSYKIVRLKKKKCTPFYYLNLFFNLEKWVISNSTTFLKYLYFEFIILPTFKVENFACTNFRELKDSTSLFRTRSSLTFKRHCDDRQNCPRSFDLSISNMSNTLLGHTTIVTTTIMLYIYRTNLTNDHKQGRRLPNPGLRSGKTANANEESK